MVNTLKRSSLVLSLFAFITLLFSGCSCKEKLEPLVYKEMKEEDVTFSDDKINFYVFWQPGCSRCEMLINWVNTLDKETRNKFNFITFKSQGQDALIKEFIKITKIPFSGTPYMVLGSDTFGDGFIPNVTTKELLTSLDNQLKLESKDRVDTYKLVLQAREK